MDETAPPLRIRSLLDRDMPAVLAIESASFEFPWCEEEFRQTLLHDNHTGSVAEYDGRIAGYAVHKLLPSRIDLLTLAVHPALRRRGIGERLIARLTRKLSPGGRRKLVTEVRETNLAAQLFFRSLSFRATAILRRRYPQSPEDAYRMVYRVLADRFVPANRIAGKM